MFIDFIFHWGVTMLLALIAPVNTSSRSTGISPCGTGERTHLSHVRRRAGYLWERAYAVMITAEAVYWYLITSSGASGYTQARN